MSHHRFSKKNAIVVSPDDFLTIKTLSDEFLYHDGKEFVDDIPKIFKDVKCVLLMVFNYHPDGFSSNLDFCKTVKEKFDSLQILYHFIFPENLLASFILFSSKIEFEFHDVVLMIAANDNKINIFELEYTENGYKQVKKMTEMVIDMKEDPKLVREKIIASSNPKKIFLIKPEFTDPMIKFLKAALKSRKLRIFDKNHEILDEYLEEASKWMFDKSYTKYHIIPRSARNYFSSAATAEPKLHHLIVMKQFEIQLPFTRVMFVPKCFKSIVFGDLEDSESIQGFNIQKDCHQNSLTFTVDAEHFLEVKGGGILYHEIEDLPEMLDEKFEDVDDKIPVIGFMNDLSVICVNQDGEYNFLESWNGWFGKELAVSFDEEKPKYCDDAFLVLPTKPTSVVYDLLKIISMPPDDIKLQDEWKFVITKDENNPVLIEFDNFDESRKLASPAFLMALMLKEHLKSIKAETGKKPTVIGICIFDEFDVEERSRVEEGLKESCKLLKIECIFVEV